MSRFARAMILALAAIALFPLLGVLITNVWYRMGIAGVLLTCLARAVVPLPWRALYSPKPRHLAQGIVSAAVLYGFGAAVAAAARLSPAARAQMATLHSWREAVPGSLAIPLLLLIVLAEEMVWRNAVTIPLAERLGPVTGAALAAALFAGAHVSLGVPLLVGAALGAGFFWSLLVVSTRSAVPALVSHALWDLSVLFLWPYSAT